MQCTDLFRKLIVSSACLGVFATQSQAQNLYWDPNGTTAGFGNFTGAWNGTNTLWNTDVTGGAAGSFTATTAGANLFVPGGGPTGVLTLTGAQSAASLDFNNTANLAAFQLSDGGSLNLSGALTDTGSGGADIRIINTTEANAATKLVASSVTIGVISVASATGGVGQFFTTGYDITMATQYSMGSGSGTGGNTTIRQTAGTVTVNNAADRGFVFLATDNFASSSSYTNRYILDGGIMRANRIGIANEDGNNNATDRWARDARLEFNNGTLQNQAANGTLLLQNQLTFNAYTGSGTKDMGYNTSKPLTVELSQTGTHTFNADGASGLILVTPSAQLVNKTGENGTVTKTGLGNLVFTGGNPLAVNSYTGTTTVSAGTVSTDYNRIAGSAATGGTDNLSNGYSAASQLVLDGGNYTMVGRGSASAGSATGVALNANAAGMQVNVGSTTGLVIGQSVSNANLPSGTYIRRITSATNIELSSMSTSISNLTGQTLDFGAAAFNNTQTINSVSLLQNATVTVTPGAGSSTTLLSFGNVSGSGGLTKAGAGTLQLTGTVTHNGTVAISAGTLEYASASNSTYTSTFSGSGTLVKSGAGTLSINHGTPGANTFSGAVIVNGGTLSMGGVVGGLDNASSFTVNNGGILFVNADALNFGPFGNLTVNAGGIFRGGVQQIGPVTLNGGVMDGTAGFSNVNFALNEDVTVGGSSSSTIQGNFGLALAGSTAAAGTTRNFNVADATGNANADLTISTAVRDSYVNNRLTNLQKSGNGTMVLSSANTYTGTTTISAGVLQLGSSGTTGALTNTTGITNNANLTINRSNAFTQATDLNGQAITGTGSFTQAGAGTTTLTAANTYTGATTISAGKLVITNAQALGTAAAGTTVASGASLELGTGLNYSTAEALTINGSGGSNGGALRGGATSSTYAGAIIAATNATIHSGGGNLTLTGGVAKNGTVLTLTGGGAVTISGTGISGSSPNSDLIVDGTTVNVDVASTYNGPTSIINGGTLNANVANALPTASGRTAVSLSGSSNLVLGANQSAASLTGSAASSVNLNANTLTLGTTPGTPTPDFAGVISGTGGLIKDGTGIQILSGANTYDGTTAVNVGTLLVNGIQSSANGAVTVSSGATLAGTGTLGATTTTIASGGTITGGTNGTIGTLTFTGNVEAQSGSTWLVDLMSGSADLIIANLINLTGSPTLMVNDSGSWGAGQSWNIAQYTTLQPGSTFGTITSSRGNVFSINYSNGGFITITSAVPEPSTVLTVVLLLGFVGWSARRRWIAAR